MGGAAFRIWSQLLGCSTSLSPVLLDDASPASFRMLFPLVSLESDKERPAVCHGAYDLDQKIESAFTAILYSLHGLFIRRVLALWKL